MNILIQELVAFAQTGLLTAFLVFLRVGAAMALIPAFGEQSVPARIRLGLAIAFTMVVAPAVADQMEPLTSQGYRVSFFLFTEVLAGLSLGIALRLFVMALQMAGTIAAQSTSLSQILGTAGIDPQPAIGTVMLISGLALAVLTGFHVQITQALILSYDVFEPGRLLAFGAVTEWGISRVAHAFTLAFTLAAPFVIASLIYNVALGVINRAMPQLMVAMVGAPAITLGGLVMLFLLMPLLLSVWWQEFSIFLVDPFEGSP